KVTPKVTDNSATAEEWQHLVPHAAVLGLVALSVGLGALNVSFNLRAAYLGRDVTLATMFWALFNGALVAFGLEAVLSRLPHYRRRTYRFATPVQAEVLDASGAVFEASTEDVSRDGGGVLALTASEPEPPVRLRLHLPDGPLTIPGEIMYSYK